MKTLIILLTLVTVTASAQVKCKYEKNEVDEFTGKVRRELTMSTIGSVSGKKLEGLVGQSDSSFYTLFYTTADLGCGTSKSITYLMFTDGEVLPLSYQGKISCGTIVFMHKFTNEELEKVRTKRIDKIRYKLTLEGEVKVTNTDFFIQSFSCLENTTISKR